MGKFTYNGKSYIAYDCYFVTNRFIENKNLYIRINGNCDGYEEAIDAITLNISKPFPDDVIALNQYMDEDKTLLSEMVRIGLVTEIIDYEPVGHTQVPICRINPDVLKQYS